MMRYIPQEQLMIITELIRVARSSFWSKFFFGRENKCIKSNKISSKIDTNKS